MRLVILVIIDISVEVIKIPNSFVPEYFNYGFPLQLCFAHNLNWPPILSYELPNPIRIGFRMCQVKVVSPGSETNCETWMIGQQVIANRACFLVIDLSQEGALTHQI